MVREEGGKSEEDEERNGKKVGKARAVRRAKEVRRVRSTRKEEGLGEWGG